MKWADCVEEKPEDKREEKKQRVEDVSEEWKAGRAKTRSGKS